MTAFFNPSLTPRRDNRVMGLTVILPHRAPFDWLRSLTVSGCALALICAGQALPF